MHQLSILALTIAAALLVAVAIARFGGQDALVFGEPLVIVRDHLSTF